MPATWPATEAVSLRFAKSSLDERVVKDGVEPFERVVAVMVTNFQCNCTGLAEWLSVIVNRFCTFIAVFS